MKVSKVYLSAVLVVLIIAGGLFAQNSQKMKRMGEARESRNFNKERMMNLPGITDEQKENMKEIRLTGMKAMQPLRNLVGEKMAKLQTLESAEKADLNAINKVIDEIASIKTAQAKIRAANKQKIRSLLNDEQRVIFDSKRHKRGQKGQRHGKGHGSGTFHKQWIEN